MLQKMWDMYIIVRIKDSMKAKSWFKLGVPYLGPAFGLKCCVEGVQALDTLRPSP